MIITKKSVGYLVLLFALIGLSETAQAWKHTFRNMTPFSVKVLALYATGLCKDDEHNLAPGRSVTMEVVGCNLARVTATVYEKTVAAGMEAFPGQSERPREAKPYYGPYSGDGTWLIAGPHLGGKVPEYVVTRDVR